MGEKHQTGEATEEEHHMEEYHHVDTHTGMEKGMNNWKVEEKERW